LDPLKRLWNVSRHLGSRVQAHRHNENAAASDHVSALIRKIPLKAEIAFMPRGRVGRNDGNEERAVVDLAPDLLIPHIPAPQLALIEKDFNTGRTQGLANPLGRLRIL
jgi:hypothetical protein